MKTKFEIELKEINLYNETHDSELLDLLKIFESHKETDITEFVDSLKDFLAQRWERIIKNPSFFNPYTNSKPDSITN